MLPDLIRPGLRVVFCGTAAGAESAQLGAYYAGPGNQFWAVLHRVGLTPAALLPSEYARVLDYGIGLTDLCKVSAGSDRAVGSRGFDVPRLISLLSQHRPIAIAFNGKTAAKAALARDVEYGPQPERMAGASVYALPSTSGVARGHWDEAHWRSLAEALTTL